MSILPPLWMGFPADEEEDAASQTSEWEAREQEEREGGGGEVGACVVRWRGFRLFLFLFPFPFYLLSFLKFHYSLCYFHRCVWRLGGR